MGALASDVEIVRASLGNPEEFALLYDRYAGRLFGYARRRVGDDVAQDVVAEAFVVAFRARDRYRPEYVSAQSWLYSIVSQQIAMHFRAETARYRMMARVGVEPSTEEFADRVGESVAAGSVKKLLSLALSKLARRDRDVLLLVAWGDLTYDEVGQALNIPVGTVRSRLNRARRKVRAVLADGNVLEVPS
ncbi:RNA polymerase sigma factor [Dactylosporangium sp. NBC_01737]|uniref:RNA polymerase sigma factor n=1 Tax=Dactylosporangium sp. NBC_01737 TaxID=2975959 RepID=UPI002E152414|nr:RNA polymerase sigma factor [Dactylosporangium sp. NBC_01737]